MQLPLFTPESSWKAPDLSSLPSWQGVRRVGIDIETCDPQLTSLGVGVRRGGYITGVSFAIERGPKFYLPMRHAGGDNLDPEKVLAYLREQGSLYKGELVGANLSYDLDYLWESGVMFPQVKAYRDIQIAAPIIYELHQSYSLDNIAKREGFAGKNEQLLREAAAVFKIDPKKDMWKLPASYVGEYAADDAELPLRIYAKQAQQISELELWPIFDLESQVLPVLVRMRRRGVRISLERLDGVEQWAAQQERDALAEVKHLTGIQVLSEDIWKAEALAAPLEHIGVKLHTTSTGKVSVDKDVLSRVDHPVATALAWARKTNKLRTTFVASVRSYMVNGRLHPTFNQIARETEGGDQKGARYGRLSCSDPNLQQQPSRDEFATQWRSIYLPEEGKLWAACDYSQQEPRWTTHFAALMDLPGARAAAQAYHDDPKLDNHQFMADLTGLKRKYAKCVFLGLCYGEGGAKLCHDLDLPTRWALSTGRGRTRRVQFFPTQEEAMDARKSAGEGYVWRAAGEEGQVILDTFDKRAPYIRKLAQKAQEVVQSRGYIVTGGGRHLHFPQHDDGSYDWTHKSLNRLIQGTSADQTKKALVALDAEGHYLQLQVHDEVDGSVSDRAEADRMAAIMRDIMPALVPFRVDVEMGASWGESMG